MYLSPFIFLILHHYLFVSLPYFVNWSALCFLLSWGLFQAVGTIFSIHSHMSNEITKMFVVFLFFNFQKLIWGMRRNFNGFMIKKWTRINFVSQSNEILDKYFVVLVKHVSATMILLFVVSLSFDLHNYTCTTLFFFTVSVCVDLHNYTLPFKGSPFFWLGEKQDTKWSNYVTYGLLAFYHITATVSTWIF